MYLRHYLSKNPCLMSRIELGNLNQNIGENADTCIFLVGSQGPDPESFIKLASKQSDQPSRFSYSNFSALMIQMQTDHQESHYVYHAFSKSLLDAQSCLWVTCWVDKMTILVFAVCGPDKETVYVVTLLQIKSLQALINMNMQWKVKCKMIRLHAHNESRHDVMM